MASKNSVALAMSAAAAAKGADVSMEPKRS